ncbi:hypothetical protein NPIL_157351, partial [Nephila pilipes]
LVWRITVNSVRYSDLLVNQLKPAIRNKRRGLLSKKVLLLLTNFPPLTAHNTIDTIIKTGLETLEYPLPTAQISLPKTFIPLDRSRKF